MRQYYLYDKKRSGLTNTPFPLTAFLLPFAPFYIFMENENFNLFVMYLEYIIVYLIAIVLSFVTSIALMPLAYFKFIRVLYRKLRKNISTEPKQKRLLHLILFIIFGPFLLFIRLIIDGIWLT